MLKVLPDAPSNTELAPAAHQHCCHCCCMLSSLLLLHAVTNADTIDAATEPAHKSDSAGCMLDMLSDAPNITDLVAAAHQQL